MGKETQSNGIENTLLQKNIEKVNQLLANRTVVKASVTELGDVKIVFDNMVKIEIIVDAVYKDCECYRLLYCEGGYVYHHIVSYDESGKALYEQKVCLDED